MNHWRLERQPSGTWLLRGPDRCLHVAPRALTGRWEAPVLTPAARRAVNALGPPRRRRSRWIWLRVSLLSPGLVQAWAARLASWTGRGQLVAAGLLGLGAAVLQQLCWPVPAQGLSLPAVAGIAGAALCHELGHAAALRRGGYLPGGIGLGIMGLLPVLTCDVTAVNLLPRRDRLRVDAAGVAWQALAAGVLALLGGWTSRPDLRLAADGAWLGVGWSLLPLGRNDGYWLLHDLFATPDRPVVPDGSGRWTPSPRRRRLLRILDAAALLPGLVWLGWWALRLARSLFSP